MRYVNTIDVLGSVKSISYNHTNKDINMYKVEVSTERLSGVADTIIVLAGEYIIKESGICVGDKVRISGCIRTYRIDTHLFICVLAKSMIKVDVTEQDHNSATIQGFLCKAPLFRQTPKGLYILDLMVAHNDTYGRHTYLPCIAWNNLAYSFKSLNIGDQITLEGRLQSREYTKVLPEGPEKRIAYEFSASQIIKDE